MYLPEDFQDYKYLVEAHDNYFILSKTHHIYGDSGDPATVNCIYQYIYPSIYTIEGTYTTESYLVLPDVSSSFSDSDFDRGDFLPLFICNFLVCVIIVWVLNNLSRLFYKGGGFSSN